MRPIQARPEPDAGALVRELVGTTCRCGAPKDARRTFCRRCYWTLPPALRHPLYRPVGQGYEAAYADAVAALDGLEDGAPA